MTFQEMERKYNSLEKEAQATAVTIGQQEAWIDATLEEIRNAFPDEKFDQPSEIPFDRLIEEATAQHDALLTDIESDISDMEARIEDANTHVRKLVESK